MLDADTIAYSEHMARSFARWTGEPLLPNAQHLGAEGFARALYQAPFVLVSHGTQADPIFRYANLAAQKLWEYDWEKFTCLPSRLSAEAPERDERARLLKQALEKGMIRDYSGVRISRSGKRFRIRNTTLWNVLDESGERIGAAAMFHEWERI